MDRCRFAPDVIAKAQYRGVDVDAMSMDDAGRLILKLDERVDGRDCGGKL